MTVKPHTTKAKKKVPAATKPRRLRAATYSSFKLTKRIKHPVKLPSVWYLCKGSAVLLWQNKGLFLGITLVYAVLNLLLVQGFAGGIDVSDLKSKGEKFYGGHFGSFGAAFDIFGVLIGGSNGSNSDSSSTASGYQLSVLLVVSLAAIWALRQVLAGSKVRIRDAYYRGMAPLIPFILVALVVAFELIPLLIGAGIYAFVTSQQIAVFPVEKFVWGVFYAGMALLSLYLIASSLFALYIVTLPNMTPMKALRSARGLVRNRRWTVIRKVVVLPIVLLIVAAVIMVPVIVFLTPIAQWVFYFLSMLGLIAVHTYMYTLYRELLRD